MPKKDNRRKRGKPISLHPLEPTEVLADLFQVKPPDKENEERADESGQSENEIEKQEE